jgi:hypothetical protein
MPDSEILEWTRTKVLYDAARVKLSNLVSETLSTLIALNQNWRNVWPKGTGWTNQYPKGQLDFDFSVWPQGSVIKDALLECHAANQALIVAHLRLTPEERTVLNIQNVPE